jgi:hypothetical protein
MIRNTERALAAPRPSGRGSSESDASTRRLSRPLENRPCSHISVGLGMEALARGYLVRYSTLDDLVRGLRHADALGKVPSKLAQLQRPHLLMLGEAGYLPLDRADANRVFQVDNRRYTRGSTIVTSNKTVAEWADTFGDEALAAAILDRLLTTPKSSPSTAPASASRAALTRSANPSTHTPTDTPRPTIFDGDPPICFGGY